MATDKLSALHIARLIIALLAVSIAYIVAGCGEKETIIGFEQGCSPDTSDTVVVPAPGLNGVVLVPGQDLILQIDKVHTEKKLIWDDFIKNFPMGWVQITVVINSDGEVVRFTESESGFDPAAFQMVWDAVQTWKYQGGCLEGELSFIFNASASTVIVECRLHPVHGYENCSIETGQLHRVVRYDSRYRFLPRKVGCF